VQKRGFPVAAALLAAKANTLDAPPAQIQPVVHVVPGGASARPSVPPGGGGGGTYKVKAGDNPSKIAAALVHDGNRWKELIAANPQKKKAANGNFASLHPGEVLELPASWTTPTNGASATPLALVHAPQGGA
jgi:nucleoid-associated protein YgaU